MQIAINPTDYGQAAPNKQGQLYLIFPGVLVFCGAVVVVLGNYDHPIPEAGMVLTHLTFRKLNKKMTMFSELIGFCQG